MNPAVDLLRRLVAAGPSCEAGRWKVYKTFADVAWWCKTGSEEFFFEGDDSWRAYRDLGGNKWWCHVDC